MEQFKQKLNGSGLNGRPAGGKASVSKRHMRKSNKMGDDEVDNASDEVLTRLDS